MREIKFRAWDKINNRLGSVGMIEWAPQGNSPFITGYYFKPFSDKELKKEFDKNNNPNRVRMHSGDLILMQYTGLKDKNGKDIYEGDIIAVYKKPYREVAFVHRKVVVEWVNSRNLTGFNVCNGQCLEIIGNIHENLELLN